MTQTSQRLKQIEETKKLIGEKEKIESYIQREEAILRINNVTMQTPLVDSEGYPRADIDVYSIRNARVALIRLYHDLESKRNEIQNALILVHQCNHEVASCDMTDESKSRAFARITGVALDSPAYIAGLKSGDLIMEFGHVGSTSTSALQDIASEVTENAFKCVKLKIKRKGELLILNVIPKPWEGKGLLGCHIVGFSE